MKIEIKKYAPVLIATLNRFVHFRRCLESLERCTGANKTDVWVALDFPPSEKYREGWQQISDYLAQKESNHGFGNLFVIRREHNYGVCHTGDNFETLIEDISKKYDRYILTEDDNEFSPSFLEYMNKSLEKFYDDNRIFLVCGYNYKMVFPEMYQNNFYISKWGCPWGTAEWVHKRKDLVEFCTESKLRECIKDDEIYSILKKRNPKILLSIINMIKNNVLLADSIKGIYATLYDKYCIMPRESMVRNWGNDGTGDHSKKMNIRQNNYFTSQPISDAETFDFTDDIFTYEPVYLERLQYGDKVTIRSFIKKIVQGLDLFLFRHFNYVPHTKYL